MKKIYKIGIGVILFILVLLISLPLLFQDKMVALIKETVNNNINANLDFADADLSLLRNFPKVSLELTDVAVTNFKPFEGDTLFYTKSVNLKLKLTELFKTSEGQLKINSFSVDDALINVLVDENGNANYDIAKKDDTATSDAPKSETEEEASTFQLSLNSYAITNSTINYTDKKGKMFLVLSDFNHSGKGDFSQQNVELDTETSTMVGFKMDKNQYINNLHLDLNAILAMDLANNKYSFLKNEAHINQLPLIFNGFVKLNETNQEVNIDFKTPSSDFKNFLALIPEQYAKNIADVKTTGDFSVTGKVNGIVSETTIPKLDIAIASHDASFKYPDLPKSVDNININAQIKNTTGNIKNTFVAVEKLTFNIDKNTFGGNAKIENITTNPYVNANLNGKIDLTDITKVYPIEMAKELGGVITANLSSSFDMDAITNNKYQRIKNNGTVELNDFLFDGKDVAKPIKINNAKVDFKTEKISLSNFDAITGDSDLKATGTINNLLGFLLSDKDLQGYFTLNSNTFKVSDFMASNTGSTNEENKKQEETPTSGEPQESLKIPAFLDCTVNANAKEVYYDNLKLENVKGTLVLKDEKATLKNVNGNMFGGNIAINGAVNTKPEKPVFDVNLGINSFDISQSFENIEMFKMLSPIASIFKGKLNTTVNLAGALKDDFTPNLASVSGKALAEILTSDIDPENSKALSLLNNNLSFIDLKKIDLKDLKTKLSFDDGKVNVSPFDIKYNDIGITVAGSHSLDQTMDYKATFNVPAKYLGKEVTNLISKLGENEGDVTVPVTANLSGAFTSPSVKTDLSAAVTNLTKQLVEKQKNKLINNTVGNLLGTNKTTKTDSTATTTTVKDKAVKKVGDVLGGLFGKKKKKE